jgi:hypothetical protein
MILNMVDTPQFNPPLRRAGSTAFDLAGDTLSRQNSVFDSLRQNLDYTTFVTFFLI